MVLARLWTGTSNFGLNFQAGSLVTGKAFWEDGFLAYEGEWKECRSHGMGMAFERDGTVGTGRWEEGLLIDGTWTYPDGTVVKVVNGVEAV